MPPNMSLESYLLYGLGRGDVWLFIFVFLAVLWGLISLLTHRAEQRGMQKERDLWKKCKESSSTDQDYVSYLEKEKDRLEQRLEEEKNNCETLRRENVHTLEKYLELFRLYKDLKKTNEILSSTFINPDGSFSLKIKNPNGNESVTITTTPPTDLSPRQPDNKTPKPRTPASLVLHEKRALEGINLFQHVELHPEFKKYTKELSQSPNNGKCILCRESVGRGDILLTDGRMIHQKCFDQCFSKLDNLKSDNDADAFLKENPQDVFRAKWLCVHYPDYPPDWISRKKMILERADYECEECGEFEDELHVHHKHPLGEGGNNSLSNLQCLCKECHEEKHGRKTEGIWVKRKDAIQKAIADKEDVEFDYTSQEGEKTHRKITPQRFENRHGWLHVKGFCHLRNAERTFNIRRMRNLKVKDDDGTTITLYQMAPD